MKYTTIRRSISNTINPAINTIFSSQKISREKYLEAFLNTVFDRSVNGINKMHKTLTGGVCTTSYPYPFPSESAMMYLSQ